MVLSGRISREGVSFNLEEPVRIIFCIPSV
jgi:hypothetical protein